MKLRNMFFLLDAKKNKRWGRLALFFYFNQENDSVLNFFLLFMSFSSEQIEFAAGFIIMTQKTF